MPSKRGRAEGQWRELIAFSACPLPDLFYSYTLSSFVVTVVLILLHFALRPLPPHRHSPCISADVERGILAGTPRDLDDLRAETENELRSK